MASLTRLFLVVIAAGLLGACAGHKPAAVHSAEDFPLGVWLNRHVMARGDQPIADFLDRMQEEGITRIYPNFWFHGYVIYPGSEYVPQHPDFEGQDPLATVLREAGVRGMEVHPWAEYGYFTHYNWTDSQEDVGHILAANPEWASRNKDGKISLHNPTHGFSHYSLNPAHPEARAFLTGILLEVIEKYPESAGLHLDRIRYKDTDWSYDDYTRRVFREEAGIDPIDIGQGDSEAQAKWDAWRREQTTMLVRDLHAEFHARFPGKVLSAAVVPPYMREEKFQPWHEWARAGYLDELMPMLYGDTELVLKEYERARADAGEQAVIHAGLDWAMGEEAVWQATERLRLMGADGMVIWGNN